MSKQQYFSIGKAVLLSAVITAVPALVLRLWVL